MEKLWTLVSVVVGGIVTYFSTSASESRKYKRQQQRENLEQVLIPYCTCLEQTLSQINSIYQNPGIFNTEQDFERWINTFRAPLVYLEAAKRVFLSHSMRNRLEKYKKMIDLFSIDIEKECEVCLSKYRCYLSSRIQGFSGVPTPMDISISMDEGTSVKAKIAMINKRNLSLTSKVSSIDFIMNDDPDNYRYTPVQLDENTRRTWSAIHYGMIDISDIEDPEFELACTLLDYMEEHTTDEQEVLERIIDETHGSAMVRNIIEELEGMISELVKCIDKITK